MGTTNVTSLPKPLSLSPSCLPGSFVSPKKPLCGLRRKRLDKNGKSWNFSPLDSEQRPAGSWEAAVRSCSARTNPSVRTSCSGSLPDLLLHHTGDDLGHAVY